MNLEEMKKKSLALIEELNPDSELLTDDPDIASKINSVINQVMFELATRYKKIPKYTEIEVSEGDTITFADIERASGYSVFQIDTINGVSFTLKANGTVYKIRSNGVAEIDFFAYPERITENTKNSSYEFELSDDALEVMPYGIAADLLKSDESAEYGTIYAQRYKDMINTLEPHYKGAMFSFEGGVVI